MRMKRKAAAANFPPASSTLNRDSPFVTSVSGFQRNKRISSKLSSRSTGWVANHEHVSPLQDHRSEGPSRGECCNRSGEGDGCLQSGKARGATWELSRG